METVYRDYAPKGVKFYYIYKALAHPELNGYVQPVTLEERLLHVREAQRTLGSGITWLADSIENDVKHAMGNAPNSEFVVDPEGKVVVRRMWSRPDELRADLERLVGKVERPTTVEELNMKTQPPPEIAARGVLPRVDRAAAMNALRVDPQENRQPFYAKLRAELAPEVMRDGQGQMYLGFHLDPIYHVHWNNLTAPLKFEITAPEGVVVTPQRGEAPQIEVASDVDPREFLIEVKREGAVREPLRVRVDYFACNDEEGWCKPLSQEYLIYFERDEDAGWLMRRDRQRERTDRPAED